MGGMGGTGGIKHENGYGAGRMKPTLKATTKEENKT